MPGRSAESGEGYRYGYQGQFAEEDGQANWLSFELRNYDPRIARWTSIDPAEQFHSPYVAMGNDPVNMVDPDGAFVESGGRPLPGSFDSGVFGDPNIPFVEEVPLMLTITKTGGFGYGKEEVVSEQTINARFLFDFETEMWSLDPTSFNLGEVRNIPNSSAKYYLEGYTGTFARSAEQVEEGSLLYSTTLYMTLYVGGREMSIVATGGIPKTPFGLETGFSVSGYDKHTDMSFSLDATGEALFITPNQPYHIYSADTWGPFSFIGHKVSVDVSNLHNKIIHAIKPSEK